MVLFYKIEQLRLLRLLDKADKETLGLQIEMLSETANMSKSASAKELPPQKTAKVTAYPPKKFFAANIQKNSASKKRKKENEMNYIAEIISQIKKNFFEENEKYFNIIFVFKDFLTKDTVPFDNLAEKLGGKAGDTFPAGIAPRLTFARTEAYWLLVSFPFLFLALDKLGINFKKRFIVVNPEAVTTDGQRAYIAHPLELKHKGNIASALKQIKHFIEHGEDPDYAQELLFDVKKFFHIQPTEGYLPLDENCLIFVGSTADDNTKKASLVVSLQKAEDSGGNGRRKTTLLVA